MIAHRDFTSGATRNNDLAKSNALRRARMTVDKRREGVMSEENEELEIAIQTEALLN